MPILPTEPALFPPDLFSQAAEEHVRGREWHVLHVKPRQEKSLARDMHEQRRPFYLPLVHRRLMVGRRILQSHTPLFPGYVFLLGDRDEWLAALNTRRVVRTLRVSDQQELWHDLRQVFRLIASNAPVTPEERLVPGTPVEIRSGPLAGLCGVVVQTATGRRLWVRVNFIRRGASVLLDDCVLAPLARAEQPAGAVLD
jgi:transcription antitermination factor NusG